MKRSRRALQAPPPPSVSKKPLGGDHRPYGSDEPEDDGPLILPGPNRASRVPSLKSNRAFRGTFVAFGKRLVFESRRELVTAYLYLNTPGIVDLWDQPPAVTYFDIQGVKHHHTFDFLAYFSDGRKIAVAVKDAKTARRKNLRFILGLIKSQNCDFADEYVLVTEQMYRREQAANAELLHFIRGTEDKEADDVVERLASKLNGETTIGELVRASGLMGRAYRSVCRLLADHRLVLRSQGLISYRSTIARRGTD